MRFKIFHVRLYKEDVTLNNYVNKNGNMDNWLILY